MPQAVRGVNPPDVHPCGLDLDPTRLQDLVPRDVDVWDAVGGHAGVVEGGEAETLGAVELVDHQRLERVPASEGSGVWR